MLSLSIKKPQPAREVLLHSGCNIRRSILLCILDPLLAGRSDAVFSELKVLVDNVLEGRWWTLQRLKDGPVQSALPTSAQLAFSQEGTFTKTISNRFSDINQQSIRVTPRSKGVTAITLSVHL